MTNMMDRIEKVLHDAFDLNLAHLTGRQLIEDGTVMRGLAEAVIDAMRQPTDRMVSDGAFQIFRGQQITEEDADAARRVWRGMITAARDS